MTYRFDVPIPKGPLREYVKSPERLAIEAMPVGASKFFPCLDPTTLRATCTRIKDRDGKEYTTRKSVDDDGRPGLTIWRKR